MEFEQGCAQGRTIEVPWRGNTHMEKCVCTVTSVIALARNGHQQCFLGTPKNLKVTMKLYHKIEINCKRRRHRKEGGKR